MISTMKHRNSLSAIQATALGNLKTNSLFDYYAQIIAQIVLGIVELHYGIHTIITD